MQGSDGLFSPLYDLTIREAIDSPVVENYSRTLWVETTPCRWPHFKSPHPRWCSFKLPHLMGSFEMRSRVSVEMTPFAMVLIQSGPWWRMFNIDRRRLIYSKASTTFTNHRKTTERPGWTTNWTSNEWRQPIRITVSYIVSLFWWTAEWTVERNLERILEQF